MKTLYNQQYSSALSEISTNQDIYHMSTVKEEAIQEITEVVQKSSCWNEMGCDTGSRIEDYFAISISQDILKQNRVLFQEGSPLGISTDRILTFDINALNLPKDSFRCTLALAKSIESANEPLSFLEFNIGECSSPEIVKYHEFQFKNNQAQVEMHLKKLKLPRRNKMRCGVMFILVLETNSCRICWNSESFHCWSTPEILVANAEIYFPRIERVQLKRERDDVYAPRKVAKREINDDDAMYQQQRSFSSESVHLEELLFDTDDYFQEYDRFISDNDVQVPQYLQYVQPFEYSVLDSLNQQDNEECPTISLEEMLEEHY